MNWNWLTDPAPGRVTSTAILLVRLVVGVAFVLHGWPKMQNPTGWMGPDGPPGFLQATAAGCEFFGGILLALGLFTRVAALALVSVMIGALVLAHIPKGHPFVGKPGEPSAELAAVYLAMSLLAAALGPGAWSLDAVLFGRRATAPQAQGRLSLGVQ